MFLVYSLLVHLAFLLLLPVLLLHPKLREGFWQRLGFFPQGWPSVRARPVFWFHGASAGDLLSLQPVVQQVRRRLPGCATVLTTITNSGMVVARTRFPEADAIAFLPYDLPWAVGRAVRLIRPDVLVLEYAEVWPALVRAAHRSGARVVITNGRFDERALGRYRWFYRLIGNPLRRVDALCMREPAEAEHALAIGADPARVRVTGNTKFDRCSLEPVADPAQAVVWAAALGLSNARPLWVAGSTHEGEEGLLLDAFLELRRAWPQLGLVLAPRYPERAERVVALARERGFRVHLRLMNGVPQPAGEEGAGPEADVAVLGTVGELSRVYSLATAVFVGGSFVHRGGQNILEPAGCGKPVLFGPHMENFADSVRVLLGRGGIQVTDAERLVRTLDDLFRRPAELVKLGRLAREAVGAVQGASQANAEVLVALAEARGAGS